MSETDAGSGLFSMPTLQYNEEGWGPHEISEDFRVMPYQVWGFFAMGSLYAMTYIAQFCEWEWKCEMKSEQWCANVLCSKSPKVENYDDLFKKNCNQFIEIEKNIVLKSGSISLHQ